MDEQTNKTTDKEVKQKPSDEKSKKNMLVCLLIVLLVALVVGGATYLWRDSVASDLEKQQAAQISTQKATIAELENQLANTETTVAADDSGPCTEVAPDAATLDNIKASINTGNTAVLSGYMASTVNVILAATEAYGPQTPAQAVDDISVFISDDSTSWDYDFSLPATTLSGYQSGDYKQYFPEIALVGEASNKQVISFSFDCDGKISTVFLLGQ